MTGMGWGVGGDFILPPGEEDVEVLMALPGGGKLPGSLRRASVDDVGAWLQVRRGLLSHETLQNPKSSNP